MGVERSQLRREVACVTVGAIVFAVWFGYPILAHLWRGDISSYPQSDWDYYLQFRWVTFYTVSHFHQFPFWTPYECGGMPLLVNPVSAVLNPFLGLDLLFGPVAGLRLQIVVQIAIAFGGGYFLARVLGTSKLAAIACAGAFAGSSWYYLRAEAGHINFLPGAMGPWLLGLFCLGVQGRRLTPAALGGLLMAVELMEGGIHPALQMALMAVVLALIFAIQKRTFFPLLVVATMGAFTVGIAAINLLPSIAYTGIHARLIYPGEVTTSKMILRSLFSRDQSPFNTFFESGAYIGIVVGGLALLGATLNFRRALPWTLLFFIVLFLAAGNHGSFSPWVVTHKLPFFGSQRHPGRWLIALPMVAGALAAFGVDALVAIARPVGAIVAALLVAIALADAWMVGTPYLHMVVDGMEPPTPWWPIFRQVVEPHLGLRMYTSQRGNLGVVSCYDEPMSQFIPRTPPHGYNQPGYRGEEYLEGSGTVRLRRWTPNELSFEVDSTAPTTIVINQNYDSNWRLVEGQGSVVSKDGLIAIAIRAGKQHIVVGYRSKNFQFGLMITLLSLIVLTMLWRYERTCQSH
jgi:hypothetical protein